MTAHWAHLGAVIALAIVTIAIAQAVTAVIAWRVGRVSVVDVTWGLGLAAVAVVTALGTGLTGAGIDWRRGLIAALISVWGCRLGWHIWAKQRAKPGEDPRYAELLGGRALADGGFAVAIRAVFGVQGLSMVVVSLPVLAAMATPTRALWAIWVGAAVWMAGFAFEVIGDAQLAAYRANPDRGPVLDTGLWAWTRHPNYFGDACVWWGIWLIGGVASGWLAGLVTIVGPIAMTYFLAYATGARLLEKSMMTRPGYREYASRTSMFLPRPPRRR
ncbi:MAG: DUF1295 domain-containing protein [Nocardioides sp.]